jgi:hypothetical protein
MHYFGMPLCTISPPHNAPFWSACHTGVFIWIIVINHLDGAYGLCCMVHSVSLYGALRSALCTIQHNNEYIIQGQTSEVFNALKRKQT